MNPAAGGGRSAKLAGPALARLRQNNLQVDSVASTCPGHAVELAREAYDQGYRQFLAVGGDGTTHEILNGVFAGRKSVERGLHARAIGGHRAAPGLVVRIVEIRRHDLGQRHRAVADRLEQLIDDGHRGRLEPSHARPIEDEAAAGAREQFQDYRMVLENIALKHPRRVIMSSNIMELSARTFFVAVSAGLETVRPSIGPINDGAF